MERAGLKETAKASDRDTIAHTIWSNESFIDSSEQEISKVIDALEDEWEESKGNYTSVDEYLQDLIDTDGLEGFLNESALGPQALVKAIRNKVKTKYKGKMDAEEQRADLFIDLDGYEYTITAVDDKNVYFTDEYDEEIVKPLEDAELEMLNYINDSI